MPRSPDDVVTPLQMLQAVASIGVVNTLIASSHVYINDNQPLFQQTTVWPCVVIEEAEQSAARIYYRMWQVKLKAILTYYNVWNQSAASLDALWATVDTDLRRIKANLEDSPALIVGGVAQCDSVVHVALSPYVGQALSKPDSPFPVAVVLRHMTLSINGLPYLSAQ